MKKILRLFFAFLFFAFLFLLLLSSVSFAMPYIEMKFIGFSENGKYLAFEELGSIGGNHGQFFTTYFVDTAKNSFVIAPISPEDREFTNEFNYRSDQLKYKQRVAKNLKKFGIQSGNLGQFVVAHFLNDFSFMKRTQRENFFFEKDKTEPIKKMMPDYTGGFVLRNSTEIEKVIFNDVFDPYNPTTDDFFELTLIPTPAKAVEGCSDGYKFELTLLNNTGHREPQLQILQKDGDILPKSRGCPLRYRIERVYVYGDRIAVFLKVFSPEYDMQYLVVTGLISGI